MSKLELRKALNGLGLSVGDDILESLMHIYQDDEKGSAEYSKFVEDIDPDAFNFAFSAGLCAKSGSFEKVEKEGVASFLDPPEKTRNSLKVATPLPPCCPCWWCWCGGCYSCCCCFRSFLSSCFLLSLCHHSSLVARPFLGPATQSRRWHINSGEPCKLICGWLC